MHDVEPCVCLDDKLTKEGSVGQECMLINCLIVSLRCSCVATRHKVHAFVSSPCVCISGFRDCSTAITNAASAKEPKLNMTTPASAVLWCCAGAGASMCAVEKGKCIDTSMGLTPLEG